MTGRNTCGLLFLIPSSWKHSAHTMTFKARVIQLLLCFNEIHSGIAVQAVGGLTHLLHYI